MRSQVDWRDHAPRTGICSGGSGGEKLCGIVACDNCSQDKVSQEFLPQANSIQQEEIRTMTLHEGMCQREAFI